MPISPWRLTESGTTSRRKRTTTTLSPNGAPTRMPGTQGATLTGIFASPSSYIILERIRTISRPAFKKTTGSTARLTAVALPFQTFHAASASLCGMHSPAAARQERLGALAVRGTLRNRTAVLSAPGLRARARTDGTRHCGPLPMAPVRPRRRQAGAPTAACLAGERLDGQDASERFVIRGGINVQSAIRPKPYRYFRRYFLDRFMTERNTRSAYPGQGARALYFGVTQRAMVECTKPAAG